MLAGVGCLLGAAAPAVLSTSSATADAGDSGCRLVELRKPPASAWGTVMDIEVVDGEPTYYGTFDRRKKDGEWHPQAVIWPGLDADPVRVGPRGSDGTVALGLTPSGLVNGWSENWETGAMRFWVQDLDSGELRFFRTRLGDRKTRFAYIRSVNRHGAATGDIHRRGEEHAWAVGYRAGSSDPFRLPVPKRAVGSSSMGINDSAQRAGFWADEVEGTMYGKFYPTVWDKDGRRHTLEIPYFDADASFINNDGDVVGSTWKGPIDGGHSEATYWTSFDDATALGLLPDGGMSAIYGLDQGGRAVGWADRLGDAEDPMTDPQFGTTAHNFFWTPDIGPGRVRVLPSLHSVSTGESDWTQWHSTHAAHASHSGLDQVGAGTHAGFAEDGTAIGAPTVFVNASECGVDVQTSHRAFWDERPGSAQGLQPRMGRGAMGEDVGELTR